MELVNGMPITTYCDREQLTTRERIDLFPDVLSAVQHAHQNGITHRDLKPSNVIVSSDDGRPVIKVIDFGIAKALSPDGKWIVTASQDKTARVWDISPRGRAPEWLPRLAEALANQHLNDQGVFESLSQDPIQVLNEIRAQLNRGPADDDWTILGRWILADRSTRTISPSSKITVPEYIGNRINENTPAPPTKPSGCPSGTQSFCSESQTPAHNSKNKS